MIASIFNPEPGPHHPHQTNFNDSHLDVSMHKNTFVTLDFLKYIY